jgi:hypothetical protein
VCGLVDLHEMCVRLTWGKLRAGIFLLFYIVWITLVLFGPFSRIVYIICFYYGIMYIYTVPRGGSGVVFLQWYYLTFPVTGGMS